MFGMNRAEVIGRLGADVTINHLTSGGRVANLSIATDESYIDRTSGTKEDRTEWHRVVSFQPGLVDMLERHARKGRLVYISGKLQTRRWRKEGEDSDRFSTEILLAPGGRVQFLDRPNGANGNGAALARGGERDRRGAGRRGQRHLAGHSFLATASCALRGRFPSSRRGSASFFMQAAWRSFSILRWQRPRSRCEARNKRAGLNGERRWPQRSTSATGARS